MIASAGGPALELAEALRRSPVLIGALRAAREISAPDWLIVAGAIRDAVWDDLHGRPPAIPRDVDLAFHDPSGLTPAADRAVGSALRAAAPQLEWDAKNQAAVHLWYPEAFGTLVAPLRSSADAVATFPETATCVGVCLLEDDDMLVVAPHGLDDLLACVCRHNPARVSASFYEQRVREKRWRERWPRMRYEAPAGEGG